MASEIFAQVVDVLQYWKKIGFLAKAESIFMHSCSREKEKRKKTKKKKC